MGKKPGLVRQRERGKALDPATFGREVRGLDGDRRGGNQVVEHREVMDRDIPEHVDVVAHDAAVQPRRKVVMRKAKLGTIEQGANGPDRRAVEKGVIHHQNQTAPGTLLDQDDGLLRGCGQRLLDQHLLPRAQGGEGQLEVGTGRRGDNDGVDPWIREETSPGIPQGDAGMGLAGLEPALRRAIRHANETATPARGNVAAEVGPPIAPADDPNPDHGHGLRINTRRSEKVISARGPRWNCEDRPNEQEPCDCLTGWPATVLMS